MTEQAPLDDLRRHIRVELHARQLLIGMPRQDPAAFNVGAENAFEALGGSWAHDIVVALPAVLRTVPRRRGRVRARRASGARHPVSDGVP